MSVFLNENEVNNLIEEISISIENYKKSLKNIDYTKLYNISDNMVYRSKR